jgi:hypothetical protein
MNIQEKSVKKAFSQALKELDLNAYWWEPELQDMRDRKNFRIAEILMPSKDLSATTRLPPIKITLESLPPHDDLVEFFKAELVNKYNSCLDSWRK